MWMTNAALPGVGDESDLEFVYSVDNRTRVFILYGPTDRLHNICVTALADCEPPSVSILPSARHVSHKSIAGELAGSGARA